MNAPKQVYCIGLGGVGVSAVAKYWLSHGAQVSGSDPIASPLTADVQRQGGTHHLDVDATRLSPAVDLVVYSHACPPNHSELVVAKQLGLTCLTFAEALGQIMDGYQQRVAIAGTNGKSTTTALTGLLLADAGFDPTVFVGSRVGKFEGNLRLGKSSLFVSEADEWRDHFFSLHPTTLAITNVELDHPDYFSSLDHVIRSFQAMVDRLPPTGQLIVPVEDPVARRWARHPGAITVGQSEGDLQYRIIRLGPEYQIFSARWRGQDLGQFRLRVPGAFNVANAALAIGGALALGAKPQTFRSTIEAYTGIWRRFEIVRPTQPTVVVDYAHHPTSIRATLVGAREFYPNRRLITVFQPHLHQRLTSLFLDFVQSFGPADYVIIQEVYAVLGREHREGMKTGVDLAEAIRAQGQTVAYAEDNQTTVDHLKKIIQPNDVVLVLGAGDNWELGTKIGV